MTDLEVGNPAVAVEGNPQTEPQPDTNGTSNQNGEARQSATAQDSFIPQGVDINTLPPNVRAVVDKINKDMVRGFTEKTSKLSETVKSEAAKATEAFRQKAELYDQIATQEEFVKQWNEYVQKANQPPELDKNGDPKVAQLEQKFQEIQNKLQMTELSQVTQSFAEATDEKGNPIHPDFDQLNSINLGKINNGEDFSLLRACVELSGGNSPQDRLANGYKMAKMVRDSIFEEGKKAGMGRLQTKALNGTNPPSLSSGDTLSVTDKKPKNAREAMDMAKKGLIVSRE